MRRIGLFAVPAVASTWMSAGVKHLSADLCPFEIGFFRSVFGLLALTSVSLRRGFNVFGGLSFMFGLSLVPLAKLTALNFTSPLFTSALAILVIDESPRMRRAAALGHRSHVGGKGPAHQPMIRHPLALLALPLLSPKLGRRTEMR